LTQITEARALIKSAVPVLCVSDVDRSCEFFRDVLGFGIDLTYGAPATYGAVTGGGATLHLRRAAGAIADPGLREEKSLASAFCRVDEVETYFSQCQAAGADIHQPLQHQPWKTYDFIVRDPMATSSALPNLQTSSL